MLILAAGTSLAETTNRVAGKESVAPQELEEKHSENRDA